jgi:hypothetical protein
MNAMKTKTTKISQMAQIEENILHFIGAICEIVVPSSSAFISVHPRPSQIL